jgi:hypothetical protein
LSTHTSTTGTSALEEQLRENLSQHDQGHPSGKAAPVDLSFPEPELEQE